MDVFVDTSRCQGIGMCEMHAPEFFEVNEEGLAVVQSHAQEIADDPDVIAAIDSCPTQALRLAE